MRVQADAAAATAARPAEVSQPLIWAWYGLLVIVVASVLAAVDRQILLLITEPLRHALGLSDKQIGALNGIALSLVAAIATVPLGWLADRVDRRVLLWVCVLIWTAATAACGIAHTYPQLFACSIGIAIGEAVLGPITYTLIPDLFPPRLWIVANYVFFVAAIVGSALGLSLSGALIGVIDAHRAALPALVQSLDTWRVALYCVALPGPAVALAIAVMRLRPRAAPAAATGAGPTHLVAYFLAHRRTMIGLFVGFGLAATAWGTNATWLPVALVRVFHESPANAGIRLGLILGAGSIAGVVLSGALVRALRPRLGDLTPLRVAEAGILAAAVLTPFSLLLRDAAGAYALIAALSVATTVALSLSPTMLQFIAPSSVRGRVVAIGGLVYVIFQSISPVLVGAISDALGHDAGNLVRAMTTVSLPAFVGGLVCLRFIETSLPATMALVAADPDA